MIGWAGPLFWPYAYSDFVDYTFYPYAYDTFWPYAYDDVYEGMFDTYAQCQASSSGRALSCIANPYFAGQSDDPYAYQNRPRAQVPGYWPGYYVPR